VVSISTRGPPSGVDERWQVGQLGLRREPGRLVLAQHAEQPPHLGQRLPGHLAQRAELGAGRFRHLAEPVGRGLGLDRDQRQVMGDHIVQFPGDPGPLLEHGAPLPFGVGVRGLRDKRALRAQPGADAVHRDRHGREHNGGAGRAVQVRDVLEQPPAPRQERQRPHPPQRRTPLPDRRQPVHHAARGRRRVLHPRAQHPADPGQPVLLADLAGRRRAVGHGRAGDTAIPVCLNPAYASYLSVTANALAPLLTQLAGLPGAPVRIVQEAVTYRQGEGNSVDIGEGGPGAVGTPQVSHLVLPDQLPVAPMTPVQLASQLDASYGPQLVASVIGDGPGASEAQNAVAAALLLAAHDGPDASRTPGLAPGTPAYLAAERFAALPGPVRHAWLVRNLPALRAGRITLAQLP
jgi:hypothetical protein